MSWLVGLVADKAESLLEKVDQTAANAFQVDKVSEVTPTNTNTVCSQAYVPGIERRDIDNTTTTGKGISKTNVNVTNSEYQLYQHGFKAPVRVIASKLMFKPYSLKSLCRSSFISEAQNKHSDSQDFVTAEH
jgi:hypothetical protein